MKVQRHMNRSATSRLLPDDVREQAAQEVRRQYPTADHIEVHRTGEHGLFAEVWSGKVALVVPIRELDW